MSDVIRTVSISGFDPEGEPEIREMRDGRLYLVFNFMPPSDVDETIDDLGEFADFDRRIEQAIGVPVVWEDRELFRIDAPRADTVDSLRAFVEGYRTKHSG